MTRCRHDNEIMDELPSTLPAKTLESPLTAGNGTRLLVPNRRISIAG
jgi:hypothetical protein